MKRHIISAVAGAGTVMLIGLVPIGLQWQRMETARADNRQDSAGRSISRDKQVKSRSQPLSGAKVMLLNEEECQQMLNQSVDDDDIDAIHILFCRWATLNGTAAFAWLEANPDFWSEVTPDGISEWAAAAPENCASWLERNAKKFMGKSDGKGGTYISNELVIQSPWWRTLLRVSPVTAIRVAGNLVTGEPQINGIALRAALKTPEDLRAVGELLASNPNWTNSQLGSHGIAYALREVWQEVDEKGWDQWVQAHPDIAKVSGNRPVDPLLKFARSTDKVAGANTALEGVPTDRLQAEAARIMRYWDNWEEAGHWLNQLQRGPVRDAGAIAYALEAAADEPAAAMRWAEEIADIPKRYDTPFRVFKKWYEAHPEAAAAWLPLSGKAENWQRMARDIMAGTPIKQK